ncbi:MAG: Gfo/Idh/MocA family oxidoreductase, partial [Runella zeae]
MNHSQETLNRREFLHKSSLATAGVLAASSAFASGTSAKRKVAMVGTGHRGTSMWGIPVIKEFGDIIEFVGLCDINPGRAETARKMLNVNCPLYTDFEKMMRETKPDLL